MATTRFTNGMTSASNNRYDGQSIGELMNSSDFLDFFDLHGDENVVVNGSSEDSSYIVQNGDQVRFNRASDEKGVC